MELTAAMAVREQDPDSTVDRSSESDSSDSEVVSFPVVVQSLPTKPHTLRRIPIKYLYAPGEGLMLPLYVSFLTSLIFMGALVSSAESVSDSKVYFCTRLKGVLSDTQSSYSHEF